MSHRKNRPPFHRKYASPPRTRLPIVKLDSNSTSSMSKMDAKRGQHKRSAILWEKLRRVLHKQFRSRFPTFDRNVHLRRGRPQQILKSHSNSTSGMSKMDPKRGQHMPSAILWENLRRVLHKQFRSLFPSFGVHFRHTGSGIRVRF